MIFQHTWQQVLDGRKTQTRRLVLQRITEDYGYKELYFGGDNQVTDGEVWRSPEKLGQRRKGFCLYAVGKTYPVQPGRGKKSVARIEITSIRRQDVRQISASDAKSEGFASVNDFLELWVKMHDKDAQLQKFAPFGEYRLLKDYNYYAVVNNDRLPLALLARPAYFYDAWVLEFKLAGAK